MCAVVSFNFGDRSENVMRIKALVKSQAELPGHGGERENVSGERERESPLRLLCPRCVLTVNLLVQV